MSNLVEELPAASSLAVVYLAGAATALFFKPVVSMIVGFAILVVFGAFQIGYMQAKWSGVYGSGE